MIIPHVCPCPQLTRCLCQCNKSPELIHRLALHFCMSSFRTIRDFRFSGRCPKSVTWSSSVRRRHKMSSSPPESPNPLISVTATPDSDISAGPANGKKTALSPPSPTPSSSSSGTQRQFDLLIGGGSSITGSVSAPILLPATVPFDNPQDNCTAPNSTTETAPVLSPSGEILNAWDPTWDFASPSPQKGDEPS